jgi:hypothetical protein
MRFSSNYAKICEVAFFPSRFLPLICTLADVTASSLRDKAPELSDNEMLEFSNPET